MMSNKTTARLVGALLEILGFRVGLVLAIPGGLFEFFIAFWLLVKGFNPSAFNHPQSLEMFRS